MYLCKYLIKNQQKKKEELLKLSEEYKELESKYFKTGIFWQGLTIASFIAASGPIAFATSFAPCAKESKAAANTKGILNKLFTEALVFANLFEDLAINGLTRR